VKGTPHPELFELGENVYQFHFKASLVHDDENSGCRKDPCTNPEHHRLLNLDSQIEVKDVPTRIDAMREVWHGLRGK
jgi:hypothetical protein